ncbi:MAG: DUF1353 domain-containing protein [Rivularia sp. (in: cyanobacteria)]
MQTLNKPAISKFPRVKLSYNPVENIWTLEEEYHYFDDIKDAKIIINKGFKFDLSSIPRIFWRIVGIHELSLEAPLIHDFMYMSKGGKRKCHNNKKILGTIEPQDIFYSRKEADDLFLKMMEEAGVSKWRRLFGYVGVWLGGRLYWKSEKHHEQISENLDDNCLSF